MARLAVAPGERQLEFDPRDAKFPLTLYSPNTSPTSLLSAGFVTPITYFYPAYFAVLLIHRERRDDHKCAAKYGAAWDVYTKLVPYRIIPYVY